MVVCHGPTPQVSVILSRQAKIERLSQEHNKIPTRLVLKLELLKSIVEIQL